MQAPTGLSVRPACCNLATHRPCSRPSLPRRVVGIVSRRQPICTAVRRPAAGQESFAADGDSRRAQITVGAAASVLSLIRPQFASAEDMAAEQPVAADQILIGVLFTLAVAALVVVTAGVAYLSITTWLDSRRETEDRQKLSQTAKEQQYAAALKQPGGGGASKKPSAAPKKKKSKSGSPKGFS